MDGFQKLIEFEQMHKWSDSAREASAEARRAGGEEHGTPAAHHGAELERQGYARNAESTDKMQVYVHQPTGNYAIVHGGKNEPNAKTELQTKKGRLIAKGIANSREISGHLERDKETATSKSNRAKLRVGFIRTPSGMPD